MVLASSCFKHTQAACWQGLLWVLQKSDPSKFVVRVHAKALSVLGILCVCAHQPTRRRVHACMWAVSKVESGCGKWRMRKDGVEEEEEVEDGCLYLPIFKFKTGGKLVESPGSSQPSRRRIAGSTRMCSLSLFHHRLLWRRSPYTFARLLCRRSPRSLWLTE